MSVLSVEGFVQKKSNKQAVFICSKDKKSKSEQFLLGFTMGSNKVWLVLKGRKNLFGLCDVLVRMDEDLKANAFTERVTVSSSGQFMYCLPMQEGKAFLLGIYPAKWCPKAFFKQSKFGEVKVMREDEKPAFRLTDIEFQCLVGLAQKIGLSMSEVPVEGVEQIASTEHSDFLIQDELFKEGLKHDELYSNRTFENVSGNGEKIFRSWLKPVIDHLKERALRLGQSLESSGEQVAVLTFKQSLATACKNHSMLMKIVQSSIQPRSPSCESQ